MCAAIFFAACREEPNANTETDAGAQTVEAATGAGYVETDAGTDETTLGTCEEPRGAGIRDRHGHGGNARRRQAIDLGLLRQQRTAVVRLRTSSNTSSPERDPSALRSRSSPTEHRPPTTASFSGETTAARRRPSERSIAASTTRLKVNIARGERSRSMAAARSGSSSAATATPKIQRPPIAVPTRWRFARSPRIYPRSPRPRST